MDDIAVLGLEVRSDSIPLANRRLQDFEGRAGRAERATRGLGAAFRALTPILAAAAAALSFRALGQMADQYTSLSNILKVLGGQQANVNKTISDLNAIASRTRTPLEAVATLYQRASIAAGDLGASQADLLRFTENVGMALAQQGGSAAAASGALMQLSQALGGGVVRAEEFNSILEGAYPIAQAAARGIDEAGGSVARLRSLIIDGKITSDEFFQAILSQTEELEAAFANTTPTIGQAFTVLGNNLTLFVGRVNEASGASAGFATMVMGIANSVLAMIGPVSEIAAVVGANFERILYWAGAVATFMAVQWVAGFVAARIATFTLTGALTALRGALVRTGLGILIVLAGELVYQFMQLVERAGGFGAAMEQLGNVAGEIWGRIQEGGQALNTALSGIAMKIQSVFLNAWGNILIGWENMTEAMTGVPTPRVGVGNHSAGGLVLVEARRTNEGGDIRLEAAAQMLQDLLRPLASTGGSSSAAESIISAGTTPIIPGDGEGGGGGGGGSASAQANAYEQATQRIREQTQALQDQQLSFGLSEQAASRTATALELFRAAQEANIAITPELINEINGLANANAQAEEATRRLTEQQRFMEQIQSTVTSGFADMFKGIISGSKSAAQSIGDLLGRLGDLLINRGFELLFGGFGGMGGGGGLLGGMIIPGILHDGGVAGLHGYGHGRAFAASTWDGAQRYHNGGIAGLRPNEVPAILERGERVIPKDARVANQNGGHLDVRVVTEVVNGDLRPTMVEIAGEVSGQQIRQAVPVAMATTRAQAAKDAPTAVAQYQRQRAGSDYRTM